MQGKHILFGEQHSGEIVVVPTRLEAVGFDTIRI